MDITTGVVLAAGEGTRLRPLTRNRPKPMLPAANRPIVSYVLDALVEVGIDRIVLVVGYKRDRVQEHFGPTYRGADVEFVLQEKQLNTGHAVLQARDAVDEPFLVVNGDRVIEPSIVESVCGSFEEAGVTTMAVLERDDAGRYGAVTLAGDRVTELVEKPGTDDYRLINGGVYAFQPTVFDRIDATPRRDGELLLTDTIAEAIEGEGGVRGVLTDGLWVDATYPWDLLEVARRLLREGWIEETQVAKSVRVATSATVHEDATLQAPVVVGPDSEVGPGAVVGPGTALGRNVTVDANATVVGSVLDADTRVDVGGTLRDCVTGTDVTLGAGTLVPGGRTDVRVGTTIHENQRLGAVLADRVTAAGGVTCEPGALVGPNAHLGTGVTVSGHVDADSEVVR